ncbi:hypothetical protein CAF53_19715 [Sphingobium sp. LB126]|uniref:acyl-CoA dehydrogenase family protein n=1 Tax=Sphingobium sp. LB126 TaxID=1983755 RepID=UPI000C20B6E2|nr:acyl-CoA dehydrogenase family protein [Sphingobium sp. LB126]PJG46408.1 hypothetical protein CAF53_19715 [Sphingobium sp. LB126]
MTLQPNSAEIAFRAEVREFVRTHLPPEIAERSRTSVHGFRDDMLGWTRILASKGWSVAGWPVEYGGTDWTPLQRHIFEEECLQAGAPMNNMQAISLVGPVIYTFGSEEQKRTYLPPIIRGEVWWAQGFSEPNAGSDLASVRTRAVLDGDEYVIDGQKIWTSNAHFADWIFCLVRTDPNVKPQQGISFILVPADADGLTIRPIESIDGGISLCEVFFDSVRVPVTNLVGEPGKGWTYAKFLLGNERTWVAEVPRNNLNLAALKNMARQEMSRGRRLIDEPTFASRLAQAEIDLLAVEAAVLRDLAIPHDEARALPIASVVKTRGSELLQDVLEMQMEALGVYGAVQYEEGASSPVPAHGQEVTASFLYRRSASIYAGANEIQRNIIAKTLLAMDPQSTAPAAEGDMAMLRESVERWVADHYSFVDRTRYVAEGTSAIRTHWKLFAEMGWLSVGLSGDVGGFDGGAAETGVILEAMGGALAIEPLATNLLAAQLIDKAGSEEQRQRLLPAFSTGDLLLAFAQEEPGARGQIDRIATTATEDGNGGWTLDGHKALVIGASLADMLVVTARVADGVGIFLVPTDTPGLTRQDYRTIDGRLASDIIFDRAPIPASSMLGTPQTILPILQEAIDAALYALCAEAMGSMEKALWTTIEYLKTRRQFGQALAEYQVLQHRLADMYMRIELSRAMLMRAAEALHDPDADKRSKMLSAAKNFICRAGRFVGAEAIQLHGGIGITEEYVAGHYLKRLKVIDMLHGNADYHLNLYMQAMISEA